MDFLFSSVQLHYAINHFMAIKSLTIRIDDTLLDKLHVVADYEGRSANSQVLILIRNCVREYEKENGEIEIKR